MNEILKKEKCTYCKGNQFLYSFWPICVISLTKQNGKIPSSKCGEWRRVWRERGGLGTDEKDTTWVLLGDVPQGRWVAKLSPKLDEIHVSECSCRPVHE